MSEGKTPIHTEDTCSSLVARNNESYKDVTQDKRYHSVFPVRGPAPQSFHCELQLWIVWSWSKEFCQQGNLPFDILLVLFFFWSFHTYCFIHLCLLGGKRWLKTSQILSWVIILRLRNKNLPELPSVDLDFKSMWGLLLQ